MTSLPVFATGDLAQWQVVFLSEYIASSNKGMFKISWPASLPRLGNESSVVQVGTFRNSVLE